MDQESTPNTNEQNAPGALLKAAKNQANFSSDQVASRLNLTVELIESLERDEYKESISPAFYRGYLRSYAQLVSIDADQLIEMYNNIIHQGSLSVAITPTFDTNLYTKKDRNYPYFKWFAILFGVIIIVFAGNYLWNKKFKNTDSSNTEINLSTDSASNQIDIPLSGLVLDEVSPPQSNDLGVKSENLTSSTPETSEKASNQSNSVLITEAAVLQMDFNGDCWVKVVDATGEVLAIGIKRTGKIMSLEGLAPFTVILGNAGVVTMSYNQQPINLSSFPAGNRIELQISADSELLQ